MVRTLTWGIALGLAGLLTFALPVALPPLLIAAEESLELSDGPAGVAVHRQSGRVYIANSLGGGISVIQGQQTLATVLTGRSPHAIVVDEARDRVYVSDFEDATVTVIDGTTNKVTVRLPVGGLGLAVDRAAGRLYAAGGEKLSIINTRNDTVIATVAAPSGANLWGLAVDEAAGLVYASDIFEPRVFVLDGRTGEVVRTIKTSAPVRFAIGLDPAARMLYVAGDTTEGSRLEAISTDTGLVVAQSAVAGYPFALAVDAARGALYLTDLREGSLTAYALPLGTRSQTLEVGSSPRGVAFHPASGRLYVVAFPEPGSAGRPTVLPPSHGRLHVLEPGGGLPLDRIGGSR